MPPGEAVAPYRAGPAWRDPAGTEVLAQGCGYGRELGGLPCGSRSARPRGHGGVRPGLRLWARVGWPTVRAWRPAGTEVLITVCLRPGSCRTDDDGRRRAVRVAVTGESWVAYRVGPARRDPRGHGGFHRCVPTAWIVPDRRRRQTACGSGDPRAGIAEGQCLPAKRLRRTVRAWNSHYAWTHRGHIWPQARPKCRRQGRSPPSSRLAGRIGE